MNSLSKMQNNYDNIKSIFFKNCLLIDKITIPFDYYYDIEGLRCVFMEKT